jgi:phosphatidylglycerophosphatase A
LAAGSRCTIGWPTPASCASPPDAARDRIHLVTTRIAIFVCTFGYVGYFPIAPGTAGSLAGLAVFGLLRWAGLGWIADAVVIAVLLVLGLWSGTHAERHFGTTDPGPGVIDEVVGMLVTLFLVPVSWPTVVAGFFVFRVLDVLKPYPANRFERFPGGMGMMADDVMSAAYSNLVLHALVWIAPGLLR